MEHYRNDLDIFCGLLNSNTVEYMLIGGLAVNYHGYQRATGDVDIWYNPVPENYAKLLKAITGMGYDTTDIDSQKYYEQKGLIRLPLDRYSIELMSIIDGKFTFTEAYAQAERVKIIDSFCPVISYEFLIENKLISNRAKDLEDIRQLEIRKKQNKNDQ